jgi:hypothetical protein
MDRILKVRIIAFNSKSTTLWYSLGFSWFHFCVIHSFNNDIDPNVAASGLSMKEGDFSKNVQFDENIVHSQFSDEENGNIAGKTSQQNFVFQ